MKNLSYYLSLFLLLTLFSNLSFANDGSSEAKAPKNYDSPLNYGLDLQYTPVKYDQFKWIGDELNDKQGHGFHLGFEWLPLKGNFGKIGFGFGVGLNFIENVSLDSGNSIVKIYALPAETFISYRGDYFKNQFVVPFAKLGLSATYIKQITSSYSFGTSDSYRLGYGLDTSLGLEICLNTLEKKAGRDLDATTGINATYLIFEYLKSSQLSSSNLVDLSHSEYRMGMRFEM